MSSGLSMISKKINVQSNANTTDLFKVWIKCMLVFALKKEPSLVQSSIDAVSTYSELLNKLIITKLN